MTSLRFRTADVFTDTPFAGNPLAFFPASDGLDGAAMQRIAGEFNLSETVFVTRIDAERQRFTVRIFTPAAELPFAGHPTIGAALLLVEEGLVRLAAGEARITLVEGAGDVAIVIREEKSGRTAKLTAPALPEPAPLALSAASAAAMLGLEPGDVIAPPSAYGVGLAFAFVPLASRAALKRARVDSARWQAELADTAAPQLYPFVIDRDIVHARMFAPGHGIAEDPATGSAAVALAGWLAAEGACGDGAYAWTIHQGDDMGRPSRLRLAALVEDGKPVRIEVEGGAVPISEGTMRVAK